MRRSAVVELKVKRVMIEKLKFLLYLFVGLFVCWTKVQKIFVSTKEFCVFV
jgi:hypothetical protein